MNHRASGEPQVFRRLSHESHFEGGCWAIRRYCQIQGRNSTEPSYGRSRVTDQLTSYS